MNKHKTLKQMASILCAWVWVSAAANAETTIQIQLDQPQQRIEGFGASDAWSTGEVAFWRSSVREQAADWLFSQQLDAQGQPQGIGLSMWRMNIGGGSAEQGEQSQIINPLRRVESFINAEGHYDWSKQAGQQWFLQQAKAHGVEKLVAFSNSPPVHYTRNGIGHGSGGFDSNLRQDSYGKFAKFLAEVLAHFDQQGLAFDYISPVNEPQYQWESNKQEGTPWTNKEIARLTRLLNEELAQRELDTTIMLSEAAEYRYLSGKAKSKDKRKHSHQIDDFFNPKSDEYVAGLSNIPKMIAGHSYWTIYNNKQILATRKALRAKIEEYGLTFYQSEYCLLGLNNITDDRPQSEWDIALFMAKIIHADMAIANAASWSFWTAMSRTNRNSKNRYLLIEKDHTVGKPVDTAAIRDSKSLWVLGNYSRFIRPGFSRVESNQTDDLSGLMASAYLSPEKDQLVTVLVNMTQTAQPFTLDLSGGATPQTVNTTQQYLTDETHNLSPYNNTSTVPPRAVLTVVYDL